MGQTHPRDCDLWGGLGWGLVIRISSQFPGDANAPDPGPTLSEPPVHRPLGKAPASSLEERSTAM